MKLVAVTRVKNELDIIEAFICHHARHFDKVVVLDDGSSDGTYELLLQLQSIYGDVVVLRQPTIGYEQNRYMTLLLRMAVDKFGADWVAPLDADEFIEPADGMMLAEVLAGQRPAVYELGWSNFAWSPDLEESAEPNPVVRQRFRLPPRPDCTKLLVHSQFVSGSVELSLGNHLLLHNGQQFATEPLERVQLCHYPIRSIAQYVDKIVIGYLQYLSTADWNKMVGFQYIGPFQELAVSDLQGITRRMSEDSVFYGVEESKRASDRPQTSEAPLNYLGGPLTLSPQGSLILPNILRHAEMMATEFVGAAKKSREVVSLLTENARLRERLSEMEHEHLRQNALQRSQLAEMRVELERAQEKVALQARELSSRTHRIAKRVHGALKKVNRGVKLLADTASGRARTM